MAGRGPRGYLACVQRTKETAETPVVSTAKDSKAVSQAGRRKTQLSTINQRPSPLERPGHEEKYDRALRRRTPKRVQRGRPPSNRPGTSDRAGVRQERGGSINAILQDYPTRCPSPALLHHVLLHVQHHAPLRSARDSDRRCHVFVHHLRSRRRHRKQQDQRPQEGGKSPPIGNVRPYKQTWSSPRSGSKKRRTVDVWVGIQKGLHTTIARQNAIVLDRTKPLFSEQLQRLPLATYTKKSESCHLWCPDLFDAPTFPSRCLHHPPREGISPSDRIIRRAEREMPRKREQGKIPRARGVGRQHGDEGPFSSPYRAPGNVTAIRRRG